MPGSARAIEAIEAIFPACFHSFAALPGGQVVETPEVSGVLNDTPLPFFNGIGRAQLNGDVDAAVERTIAIYRARQRAFRWWVPPSTRPPGLEETLRRHGFRHVYDSTGMHVPLGDEPRGHGLPRELTIRRVTSRKELQAWAEILLTVFARPPHETAYWIEAYSHLGLDGGPWTHYVGWVGDEPAATASVLITGRLAGVYHVATLPQWRGRRFAAALTLETMRQARNAGATEIVLQSSEMGLGVYESLGFQRYCDLTLYDLVFRS